MGDDVAEIPLIVGRRPSVAIGGDDHHVAIVWEEVVGQYASGVGECTTNNSNVPARSATRCAPRCIVIGDFGVVHAGEFRPARINLSKQILARLKRSKLGDEGGIQVVWCSGSAGKIIRNGKTVGRHRPSQGCWCPLNRTAGQHPSRSGEVGGTAITLACQRALCKVPGPPRHQSLGDFVHFFRGRARDEAERHRNARHLGHAHWLETNHRPFGGLVGRHGGCHGGCLRYRKRTHHCGDRRNEEGCRTNTDGGRGVSVGELRHISCSQISRSRGQVGSVITQIGLQGRRRQLR